MEPEQDLLLKKTLTKTSMVFVLTERLLLLEGCWCLLGPAHTLVFIWSFFPLLLNEMIVEPCVCQTFCLHVCECMYSPCSGN